MGELAESVEKSQMSLNKLVRAPAIIMDDRIEFNGHKFKEHYFKKPTFCVNCRNFLWGITNTQGCICEDCGVVSHKGCIPKTPISCSHSNQQPSGCVKEHKFEIHNSKLPEICNHCGSISFDFINKRVKCSVCQIIVHEKCVKNLTNICEKNLFEPFGRILIHFRLIELTDGSCSVRIFVEKARYLIPMDYNGYSDPYVKIVWTADDGKERLNKTEVIKKNLSPEWLEYFNVTFDEKNGGKKITIEVWDHDTLSPDDFMGSFSICLKDIEENNKDLRSWFKLFDKKIGERFYELIYDEEIEITMNNEDVKKYFASKKSVCSSIEAKEDEMDEFVKYLKKKKPIGSGSFATVYLANHVKSEIEFFAVKVLKKRSFNNRSLKYFSHEMFCMSSLDSMYLAKAFACHVLYYNIHVVMEYCENGNLFDILYNHDFTESETKFCIAEVLLALEYLKSRSVVHRDIKSDNVLVTTNGHMKLADFGFAKKIEVGELCHSLVGTPLYVAPEIVNKKPYAFSVDMWSLGVVFYSLLERQLPFVENDFKLLYEKIKRCEMYPPKSMSPVAKDIVMKMMELNEDLRIGSKANDYSEIKQHKFFAEIDWESLQNGKVKSALSKTKLSTESKKSKEKNVVGDKIKNNEVKSKDGLDEEIFETEFEKFNFTREGFDSTS